MRKYSCVMPALAAAVALGLVASTATAGPWNTRSQLVATDERQAGVEREFEITVTLDYDANASYPQTVEERLPYEAILNAFAETVYEMTEGKHRLAKIRVFSNGRFASSSDIRWRDAGWPRASPGGLAPSSDQFTKADTPYIPGQIFFSDQFGSHTWLFSGPEESDRAGILLAYLWAQYAYGLLPEHEGMCIPPELCHEDLISQRWAAQPGDVTAGDTLLSNPWVGDFGNRGPLNLSTDSNYENAFRTAQYRSWRASSWDTLGRPLAEDPIIPGYSMRPSRLPYSEFVSIGGEDFGSQTNDLPDEFRPEILWVGNTTEYSWVLDRSGSMSGSKIENLRDTCKLFAYLILETDSVGVVTFSTDFIVPFPLSMLTFSARQELKMAIDAILSGGGTNMFGGAFQGLDMLINDGADEATKVMFLLSDGQHNSGPSDFDGLVSLALQHGVPIFTFAYGSSAAAPLLEQIADATGGNFYFSPTDQGSITRAFLDANQQASERRTLVSASTTVEPEQIWETYFSVDSSIERMDIVVSYETNESNLEVILFPPTPNTIDFDDCQGTSSRGQCSVTIGEPQPGNWHVQVKSNSFGGSFAAGLEVSAIAFDGIPSPEISVEGGNGRSTFSAPEPALLTARFNSLYNIANAEVTATVYSPNDQITDIRFFDDGLAPDSLANDGVYAALMPYEGDGNYNVEVFAFANAEAWETSVGTIGLPAQDGNTGPIVMNFLDEPLVRFTRKQFRIIGAATDHVGNSPDSASTLSAGALPVSSDIHDESDADLFKLEGLAEQGGEYRATMRTWNDSAPIVFELLNGDALDSIQSVSTQDSSNDDRMPTLNFDAEAGAEYYVRVSGESSFGYFLDLREISPTTIPYQLFDFELPGFPHHGWEFSSPSEFAPATGTADGGKLMTQLTSNTNSFANWYSPEIGLGHANPSSGLGIMPPADGIVYRANYNVSSSNSSRQDAPGVRFRAAPNEWGVIASLLAESVGPGHYSPDTTPRLYQHYYSIPSAADDVRLFGDVLGFNPANDAAAAVTYHQVQLEALDLSTLTEQRTDANINLGNNSANWTSSEPIGNFRQPVFNVGPDGVKLSGRSQDADEVIFGYWTSEAGDSSVVLGHNRLYRLSYTVESDADVSEVSELSTVRCRINTESYLAAADLHLSANSDVGFQRLPSAGNAKTYELFFAPPPVLAGEKLILSFDFLHVPTPGIDPTHEFTLRGITVDSWLLNTNGGV